ncbi:MAG TPA: DUF29 family protein [Telluria sp.]
MGTSYEADFVAWAKEQAGLLRSGNLFDIDALNIAEEIESIGRRERNELQSWMAAKPRSGSSALISVRYCAIRPF